MADPALAVLEMAIGGDGNAICEALRRGATTLASLHNAVKVMPWATGNAMRRRLLDESKDEPWSPLERAAHVLLRDAGVTGCATNHLVKTPGGRLYRHPEHFRLSFFNPSEKSRGWLKCWDQGTKCDIGTRIPAATPARKPDVAVPHMSFQMPA